jgi:hypothetical protein
MVQVFHGGQGPSKPREGEGRQRQRTGGETIMEAERCPDILGKGGEGRAWRHDTCLGD